jgi:hypothetical protein
VCCLVVWVLNDHVLKEAWPGWVTGKLSDVTGLVVAPLLAATVLALLGVRRPLGWGSSAVVAGFVVVKASVAGAAAVSAAWGLTGFPTRMLADPTDLLALPAVSLAVVLWQRAAAADAADARRRWSAALGVALLPVGVLTTAATSCDAYEGVYDVVLAERVVRGEPAERVVAVRDDFSYVYVVDAGGVRAATSPESRSLGYGFSSPRRACTEAGLCWRVADGSTVEGSLDDGRTWSDDLALDAGDRAAALEGHEESCGEVPVSTLTGVAVLDDGQDVRVVVAASHTGIWIGGPGEEWRRIDGPLRGSVPAPQRERAGPRPRPWLRVVEPDPPYEPVRPDGVTATRTRPPCPDPSSRTVTPHPSNGPPTTYEVCP